MRRKSTRTVKKNARSKTKLGLPDLDQPKTAVRRQAYEAPDSELLSPDIHGAPPQFSLIAIRSKFGILLLALESIGSAKPRMTLQVKTSKIRCNNVVVCF